MKTVLLLSAFALITTLATTVNAQGTKTTTDANGNVTKTEPDNTYGDGGTVETTSDSRYRMTKKVYRDKCGRIREHFEHKAGKKFSSTAYHDENGSESIVAVHHENADDTYEDPGGHNIEPKRAQRDIDRLKKKPVPPCPPPPKSVKTGPPEKPRELPDALGAILQHVNIGVGVGDGRTIGHSDHLKDRHLTKRRMTKTSSSRKTVAAGCKCHPCTCSPCRCH